MQEKMKMLCKFFSRVDAIMITVVIYKILLDLIYVKIISLFGFTIEYSMLNIVSGYIFVVLVGFCIYYMSKYECASNIFIIGLSLMYFIPITTFCGMGNGKSILLLGSIIFYVCLIVCQIFIPIYVIDNKRQNKYFNSKRVVYCIALFAVVFVAYMCYRYNAFDISLNLFDVYETRAKAGNVEINGLLVYIFSIIKKVIPVLIIYLIYLKRYLFAGLMVIVELFAYSTDAVKSIFFLLFLVIFGYIFYRKGMYVLMLPGIVLLELLAFGEYFLRNTYYVVDLFFRRVMIVPANLANCYIDFFTTHTLDFGRNNVLGKLGMQSPYSTDLANVIGNNYLNQDVAANTGILGDAYATLGFLGVIIFPIIFIFILRILDLATINLEIRLTIGVIIYYIYTFSNAIWSTTLLSHGFLVICLVLLLFSNGKEGNLNEKNIS